MLTFFRKCFKPEENVLTKIPRCYVGVSAAKYGEDYDIAGLCSGKYDALFSRNFVAFGSCEIFKNLADALKVMERRGVTDNSSFIVVVACDAEILREAVKTRNFSELIRGYINARIEPIVFQPISRENSIMHGMLSF